MTAERIHDIFQRDPEVSDKVTVNGWVRSLRKSKKFSFIHLFDGSTVKDLQIIVDLSTPDYEQIVAARTGQAMTITGKLQKSYGKQQGVEVVAEAVTLVSEHHADDYPLQKKATSLEFLREVAHLRLRTKTYASIFRIRHQISFATHKFFHDKGFCYLHSPIITASDCEGAGDMFHVTSFDLQNVPKKKQDGKEDVDYDKDFFAKATHLTVSGQLSAECFAQGMGQVYTFGPTFRAENSNTARHLAEFWMIEPEMAFAELPDVIILARDYVKYLIKWTLENAREDLLFLQDKYDEGLVERLEQVLKNDFETITYTKAIDILMDEVKQQKVKFEYPVEWGCDLQTEHERYLTEKCFNGPVVVTDYPKDIKAFYMKQNADDKTVRALDVLLPGVGEIIGGSQREDDLSALKKRIDELNLPFEDYDWYLDLRKFGSTPHAGFGLGLERMVMYMTGMKNIRDVIPFPRTPRSVKF